MIIKITYYGLTSEITACDKEQFLFEGNTADDLKTALCSKYPALKNVVFQLAQRNEVIAGNMTVNEEDTAIMPPFAGG